jgi:hypothetical protein
LTNATSGAAHLLEIRDDFHEVILSPGRAIICHRRRRGSFE